MKRLLMASAVFAWGSLPHLASAQADQPSATLDQFSASETPEDDFHLSRPTDLGHLRWGAQLHLDYALNPLVFERRLGESGSEGFSIVEHHLVGTVGASLGLFDRVVVYGGLPVTLVMDGASEAEIGARPFAAADGAGLGDAYLGGRVRIWGEDDDAFVIGAQATLTLPTAGVPNDPFYRGERSVSFLPEVLAEVRPGFGWRIVANVGARIREEDPPGATNVTYGHQLTLGLGAAIPVWTDEADPRTHVDAHAQLYGATTFAHAFDREHTPFEWTVGAKLFHASGLMVGLAGGSGFTRGFGSPDLRGVLTAGFVVPEELAQADADADGDSIGDDADRCPSEPEDADGFEDEDGCPDTDNDDDGVLDADDACPSRPETRNGIDDEDGCPDERPGDTDGDGITDDVDQCAEDAEDADGFEDEDGCPDADNDADGVTDARDHCPLEAGVVENRGCPDTDRDGDTVVDRLDNCPTESGSVENRGCVEAQQVAIDGGSLQILDRVYFRTARSEIRRRSFALLDNVARVLNAHPEIERVVVEGHTDSRGSRERNLELSRARAQAVVDHLVQRGGVDAARLSAQGFGPDRPVVPDASSASEHAQNRRVEFHVVGDDAEVQQSQSGPDAGAIDR